jgi:hypothetical protein
MEPSADFVSIVSNSTIRKEVGMPETTLTCGVWRDIDGFEKETVREMR